jgi:hypothetical protein
MSDEQTELCGKCGTEIDPCRRVDFTLKDGTRVRILLRERDSTTRTRLAGLTGRVVFIGDLECRKELVRERDLARINDSRASAICFFVDGQRPFRLNCPANPA